jgi:carboxyl-terminal processing protease
MLAIFAAVTISPTLWSAPPPANSPGLTLAPVFVNAQQSPPQDPGRILNDVFGLLDKKYVRDLGSEKLFNSGLKALLEGLDPHTQYFNPQEAKQLRRSLEDKFGGIGVVFKPESSGEFPEVIARFLNAPAARAGIQKGDLVVEVDGQSTRGLAFEPFVSRIMGRVGTTVTLAVRRPGEEKLRTFSIRRATIRTSSIRGLDQSDDAFWLDKHSGIGYVRISRFTEDTVPSFRSALSRLKKGGVRAIVIDLRSNFGGLLSAAVKTADIFVDSGLIVRSLGRGGQEEKWIAHKGEEVTMPISVLVDQDTASASEVFSACLQDHHRALIVGVRSFGKGSIQRLFKVGRDGALLKMTTALYFPPSGRHIDKLTRPTGSEEWGVTPDPGLEVKLEEAEKEPWLKNFFAMDDQVGTDMDMPAYSSSSDKVLLAARDALRKSLGAQKNLTPRR